MAMVITPESALGQELAKWEQPGYNPAAHPFPAMLYKARDEAGRFVVDGPNCQTTVQNEYEQQEFMERGWRKSPTEAIALLEGKERLQAEAAAHRAHEDRNMSEMAQAEIAEAEAATPEHLAEVPVKRRGRPKGSKNKPKAA